MGDYVIGVDVGGTFIKSGAVDRSGKVLLKKKVPTQPDDGSAHVMANIEAVVQSIIAEMRGRAPRGIGLVVPGILNRAEGKVVKAVNLQKLEDFPLVRELRSSLPSIPVVLENDANGGAIGEGWVGAARECENFYFVTLGTGVGGALILKKELWLGDAGKAGEFGHIVVDPAGGECDCGRRGCLELYASSTGLHRLYKQYLAKGARSLISDLNEGNDANVEIVVPAIFNAFEERDVVAQEIVGVFVRSLAAAMADVMNLMDVNTFVYGGGLGGSFNIFVSPLKDQVLKLTSKKHGGLVNIYKAGENAGLLGAASRAWSSEDYDALSKH